MPKIQLLDKKENVYGPTGTISKIKKNRIQIPKQPPQNKSNRQTAVFDLTVRKLDPMISQTYPWTSHAVI